MRQESAVAYSREDAAPDICRDHVDCLVGNIDEARILINEALIVQLWPIQAVPQSRHPGKYLLHSLAKWLDRLQHKQ